MGNAGDAAAGGGGGRQGAGIGDKTVRSASSASCASSASPSSTAAATAAPRIKNVWASNLDEELRNIGELVADSRYTFIAMDTEFPGIVSRPLSTFSGGAPADFAYQTARCNVDMLRVIQVGLCVSDAYGNLPGAAASPSADVWQFNFYFSLADDVYAQQSVDLLAESGGIDFAAHKRHGIDVYRFGELLITSGIVLNERLTWITFHGVYDFAYLLKLANAEPLPETSGAFYELLGYFFPRIYDVRQVMGELDLHGGLNKIAATLQIGRYGRMHQAGSDALLTLRVFMRLREAHAGAFDVRTCLNTLYGVGGRANGTRGGAPGGDSSGSGSGGRRTPVRAS